MRAAAKQARVFCKVSALVELAKARAGEKKVPEDLEYYEPILKSTWEIFGDDRLIYGSDWPVSDIAAPYRTVFSIVNEFVKARGAAATVKYFWKNAQAAYRWPVSA